MEKHIDYFEVRWKNFKGFDDTKWIKIKPVTVLLGSNNSGKSNFLAPFLLMNQTINSNEGYSPLILKGSVYDCGSYQELVKDYITEKGIFFGYKYHINKTDENIDPVGTYPPGGFEIIFDVNHKDSEVRLKKYLLQDIYGRRMLSLSRTKLGKFRYSGIGSKDLEENEKLAINESKPTNFYFSANRLVYNLERIEAVKEKKTKEKIKRKPRRFSKGLSQILGALSLNEFRSRDFLGELSFIGPIRESPKRVYEISNEIYPTVGSRGQYTANLIRQIGNDNEKLNSWVKRFGFGDCVELYQHHSNIYSLRFLLDSSDSYTTITNAGFGASQVLPLIVQSIVSTKRDITIAEQPEIHLNPKYQCELADLFVEMANNDQTILVETHSEHLLLRLRRLIADGTISSNMVAVYFVEKDDKGSAIKEIKIGKKGEIDKIDWPPDFFGESLKESLALAAEQLKEQRSE